MDCFFFPLKTSEKKFLPLNKTFSEIYPFWLICGYNSEIMSWQKCCVSKDFTGYKVQRDCGFEFEIHHLGTDKQI